MKELQYGGPKTRSRIIFYVPPYVLEEAPTLSTTIVNGKVGGVRYTPFAQTSAPYANPRQGTTTYPTNNLMANHVGGHEINLQNYVNDITWHKNTGKYNYPRL
ncbi:MAG: hypothetical protein GWN01_04205, partial [Nitrosopumilaceae archaeon]|nr:hypothetical protein [Nitrosopumilaceae archaeon]NIU86560.1 hypothetical protein [Nitrosopumilaceae archaeon]NIV65258.1 hypothetical protein [Nitrosopumilaceae archaeon]NIX60757.1 hypothetical protein [Nitrosopumilaceae archaeon]